MASIRDMKRRRDSIAGTLQITRAMKLVAGVKLRQTEERAVSAAEVFGMLYQTMQSIARNAEPALAGHVFGLLRGADPGFEGNPQEKTAPKGVAVITSNRGLAGGYNAGVVAEITEHMRDREQVLLYTIGERGAEALRRAGYRQAANNSFMAEEPSYENAKKVGADMIRAYETGEISEIWLAGTHFKNAVLQEPRLVPLLPPGLPEEMRERPGKQEEDDGEGEPENREMLWAPLQFEPSAEEVLSDLLPFYVSGMIYDAMVEAAASENGARVAAMDAASENAEEMIGDLTLRYHRARQGIITQELTEIVSGSMEM